MEKEFVTFKIAKDIKEIGFNEECFAIYMHSKRLHIGKSGKKWSKNVYGEGVYCSGFAAPLWQQVIDWFRDVKDIHINPVPYHETADHSNEVTGYYCGEITHTSGKLLHSGDDNFSTYYEAREFAIKEAIKILEENYGRK